MSLGERGAEEEETRWRREGGTRCGILVMWKCSGWVEAWWCSGCGCRYEALWPCTRVCVYGYGVDGRWMADIVYGGGEGEVGRGLHFYTGGGGREWHEVSQPLCQSPSRQVSSGSRDLARTRWPTAETVAEIVHPHGHPSLSALWRGLAIPALTQRLSAYQPRPGRRTHASYTIHATAFPDTVPSFTPSHACNSRIYLSIRSPPPPYPCTRSPPESPPTLPAAVP